MISAQTETQQQERLIENYMSLPNQVWDGIILQATQVSIFVSSCSVCLLFVYKFVFSYINSLDLSGRVIVSK